MTLADRRRLILRMMKMGGGTIALFQVEPDQV